MNTVNTFYTKIQIQKFIEKYRGSLGKPEVEPPTPQNLFERLKRVNKKPSLLIQTNITKK
jgi:hypothetical protein